MKDRSGKLIVLILMMMAVYFAYKNGQMLSDRYVIWRNPPSAEVVEFADRTGMRDLGRQVFFASTPSIDDAEAFNEHCSDIETTMIILGCHVGGKIYVFNVRDERIADAKYVTSAHEMLHAAYVRLSEGERAKINNLLEDEYRRAGDSAEFRTVMAEYAQVEPGQRDNELHSILGTEFAALSPELEDYYARYFTDRHKVANMTARYKEVFAKLEDGQTKLKAQLDRLAAKIKADSSLFDTLAFQLNDDIDAFNTKEFRSRTEWNAARQALVEREHDINSFKWQINADISRYDAYVEEYNSLGGKIAHLNQQIDSKSQAGIRTIKGAS
ncbi:MAG: hypothetical protein LBP68_08745 [Acidobacteriota bacterium]|jgi:hypothetical protein|nr:hypothetical protein [Acidobacteriota bacterium]